MINITASAVCVGFLSRLYGGLMSRHVELTPAVVEEDLLRACGKAVGKENRLVREELASPYAGEQHSTTLTEWPIDTQAIDIINLITHQHVWMNCDMARYTEIIL